MRVNSHRKAAGSGEGAGGARGFPSLVEARARGDTATRGDRALLGGCGGGHSAPRSRDADEEGGPAAAGRKGGGGAGEWGAGLFRLGCAAVRSAGVERGVRIAFVGVDMWTRLSLLCWGKGQDA